MRVFSDRMINTQDSKTFEKLMEKIVLKEWGEDWNNIAKTSHGNIIFVIVRFLLYLGFIRSINSHGIQKVTDGYLH